MLQHFTFCRSACTMSREGFGQHSTGSSCHVLLRAVADKSRLVRGHQADI